jgi:hypothetical protein
MYCAVLRAEFNNAGIYAAEDPHDFVRSSRDAKLHYSTTNHFLPTPMPAFDNLLEAWRWRVHRQFFLAKETQVLPVRVRTCDA